MEDEEQVEIAEGDLKPGQEVVIEGNLELENGMAAKVAEEKDEDDDKDAAPAEKGSPSPEKQAAKAGAEKAK